MKKIAVIGGGWYGCHIARVLKLAGYDVTLFESCEDIFKGISGNLGIRLHAGPHYPRSEKTRKSCREGFAEFIETYPDLVIKHAYSIYGLGTLDANGNPPKIDIEKFRAVGKEVKSREIEPKDWGYSNLQAALDVEEPSILLGDSLREKFRTYLRSAAVKVVCNAKVHNLVRLESTKTIVMGEENVCFGVFDYIINTTSYRALLPSPELSLPFALDVVYQPCLALVYEDKLSKVISLPPFSFIVMDGWFPCIMPYVTSREEPESTYRKYIVTHGKYTIMGSYKTVEEASVYLAKINDMFVTTHIQPKCEAEMQRFWPLFGAHIPGSTERRFQYVRWKGTVLAKIKTNREFRSAVTFAKDHVVYVIPGKVSNIFDAGHETLALINNQNVLYQGAYQYVKGGTLDDAVGEITEAIDPKIRNTCNLQTYAEIVGCLSVEEKAIPPELMRSVSSRSELPIQWVSRKGVVCTSEPKRSSSVSFFQTPPKTPVQSPVETLKTASLSEGCNYKLQIISSL